MNKNVLKNFKVAPKAEPKKPGLFARVSGWIKGLVSKTVAAVKKTADRVKQVTTSAAKKTWNYVVPPLRNILKVAVRWTALIVFVTVAIVAPLQMLALTFSAIGVATVALVAWAYLAALQETRPWARTILKICAAVLGFVGVALEVMVLVSALSNGLWVALGLLTLIAGSIYLQNELPRIIAVVRERREAREEQEEAELQSRVAQLNDLLETFAGQAIPNPS